MMRKLLLYGVLALVGVALLSHLVDLVIGAAGVLVILALTGLALWYICRRSKRAS